MSTVLSPAAAVGLAVVLAAVGAVVFGLAAVRQHGAVRATATDRGRPVGWWRHVGSLLRDRSWLVGGLQSVVGGALHVLALALAPITLVQPIGVLAVPTTVIATAVRDHRRPARGQLLGTVLGVAGIVAVTVALLLPGATTAVVPPVSSLVIATGALVVVGLVVLLVARRLGPGVRAVALAVAAAALFGLNSVLIRTIGEVVARNLLGSELSTVLVAAVGLLVALPLGVVAMQTAYRSGSAQVVMCCLTLMDPITAVTGGRLLLHDGGGLPAVSVTVALIGGAVTAAGVVLMSREVTGEPPAPEAPRTGPAQERDETVQPLG